MASNISKNSNVAKVPAKKGVDFFYKWLSFIRPFHNLTKTETKVLSFFLEKRSEYTVLVKDEKIITNILKSSQTKKEIREALGMTSTQFNLIFASLKRAGAIVDGKINVKYIPNVEYDSNEYRMILIFDITDEESVHIPE